MTIKEFFRKYNIEIDITKEWNKYSFIYYCTAKVYINDMYLAEETVYGFSKKEAKENLYRKVYSKIICKTYFDDSIECADSLYNEPTNYYEYTEYVSEFKDYLNLLGTQDNIKNYLNLINKNKDYTASKYVSINNNDDIIIDNKLMTRCIGDIYTVCGNDRINAVLNGIYSWFEEYTHTQFYSWKDKYKIIDEETLPVNLMGVIKKVEKDNIDCVLVDCSSMITFPIIALVTVDKTNHTCYTTVGANIDKEIAIKKCFAKRFLLNDFSTPIPQAVVNPLSLYVVNRTGTPNCLTESVFINREKINYDGIKAFTKQELLSNYDIYVNDVNSKITNCYCLQVYVKGFNLLHNLHFQYSDINYDLVNYQLDTISSFILEKDEEKKTELLTQITLEDSFLQGIVGEIDYPNTKNLFKHTIRDNLCNPIKYAEILMKDYKNTNCKNFIESYIYTSGYNVKEEFYNKEYLSELLELYDVKIFDSNVDILNPTAVLYAVYTTTHERCKNALKSILVRYAEDCE